MTRWTKAMQDSLNQIMKSVHEMKKNLLTKVPGDKKSSGTGSHAENKHA